MHCPSTFTEIAFIAEHRKQALKDWNRGLLDLLLKVLVGFLCEAPAPRAGIMWNRIGSGLERVKLCIGYQSHLSPMTHSNSHNQEPAEH
jgi:hypothetical protein